LHGNGTDEKEDQMNEENQSEQIEEYINSKAIDFNLASSERKTKWDIKMSIHKS